MNCSCGDQLADSASVELDLSWIPVAEDTEAEDTPAMARIVEAPQRGLLPNGLMPAGWWHEVDEQGRIHCDLCPRACSLKPGDRGFCFVRENVDGEMVLSTYGRSTGFCIDPIEKKPLNHFLPGTAVLSFGTAGCNLGCKFCQNWDISKSREVARASENAAPEAIAEAATQLGCHSVAFTYNDPVIWAEYAVDTARACHARGVQTVAVTAGYITPEARQFFFSEIDAANVDLKAFGEEFYRQLTYSHLQPVLDTLVWLKQETNVWFEITNLMIPRENDSPDEVRRMCDWIVENLGDEVPVHFTAFHPDFRMLDHPATPLETLLEAYRQARAQGIKYVYVGNVHDPTHDSTYCPHCSALLIQRNWHELGAYHLQGNRCGSCNGVVAGRFLDRPGSWGRRRQPVQIAKYAKYVPVKPGREPASKDQPSERPLDVPSEHSGSTPTPGNDGGKSRGSGPQLTQRQQQSILRAACEFVISGVGQRAATLPDPTLDGAAEVPVMGAFVTLKRSGHLRACCGSLGQTMPLLTALRGAAQRTATDDRRFPPLSVTELPFLDVDVSLLHSFQDVSVAGPDRIASVEIGRHGVTIHRDQASGLLLPNVAVENNWDSETFLRQVCRKAGLASTAWQDAEARLQTFETLIVHGTIDADQLACLATPLVAVFTAEELGILSEHCRTNVQALLQGATPSYYIPTCRDLEVQGVLLSLELPSRSARPQFARMSMRPGLPLQSTLFQLCESAARWLIQANVSVSESAELLADVSVLHDSAMHGTVALPDLRGMDAQHRVLVAAQHGRFAWRFAPTETPEQLMHKVIDRAQIFDPQTAALHSFAVDTKTTSFFLDNVACPVSGPAVRAPAVAGVFYPAEKQELEQLVDQLVTGDDTKPEPVACRAILVPHAGLRFSGRIAADVYRRVAIPDRVIVLGPKHTRAGTPWAVAPHATWSIPGLQVDSDQELAGRLASAIPRLELDAAAHREEHAIEVQLPLLARFAPQTKVVGITIGEGDVRACCEFADQLATVLRGEANPPLLVISTDLNHYASDPENRRLDRIALTALERLNPAALFETVRQHDISMCGLLPAVIVLQTLCNLGALKKTPELVAYATSADAGGNVDRVVGYAGMLFW